MRFYRSTAFLFPRSYSYRIFAICFASVHVPLLTFALVEAITGRWQWELFLPLLSATAIGSIAGVIGLRGLLKPVRIATDKLTRLQQGEDVGEVPAGGRDMAGQLLHAVAVAVDATRSRIERLHDEACHDPLTGLYNRRGFDERVAAALANGAGGVVALLDGDNFKQVNDRLGHEVGDRLLRGLARRIAHNIRSGDIAARWGGDEFVVFFPGMAEADARGVIERLQESVIAQPDVTLDGASVAFSYGIAALERGSGDRLDAALAAADRGLYEGKRRKRAA